ncbi:hypothetical protein Poli38472_003608 [Pythium oligandrum]|uniref:Transmembrane protein n=1 Tax=Pythium oligandrum TaxID=41045 RepID=A0A8K1CP58_PYTOL|nr:hypothetical protein Poli38472_003608 [Pythium oligandrum]|eukprot:TMW65843.1 hypothetical protein Poli38472_003608 [Pythium oligandrum]
MPLNAAEIVERVSAASLNKKTDVVQFEEVAGYVQTKSPGNLKDFENGALRAADAPKIYSKQHIGLLVHHFTMGLINNSIYLLVYPFLNNYLHMSGVATASVSVLTTLPYTFKFFFGILSDCFPIFGYRRRPYMVIGTMVCTICCFVMAVLPIGAPYYPDPMLAYMDPSLLTPEQLDAINVDAPNSGTAFVLLLIFANLGIVIANSAIGGVLIELSQREPEAVRGTAQTMIWVASGAGGMVSAALVGFGLNSAEFGGTFSGSIGVHGIMWCCTVASLVTTYSVWFNVSEEKVDTRLSFRKEVRKIYDLIHHRVVYQILLFHFFKNMFSNVSVTAAYPIQSVWVLVTPLNSSIASILANFISAATLAVVAKVGLGWNWRAMVVVTSIGVIIIDVFPTFLTIWNVVRSQWFWLGLPLVEQIPMNIGLMVANYCMIEIADEGSEAAFYGLLVSVSSLSQPFSTVITKNVDAHFDIDFPFLQVDDHHVRMEVTYAYLFSYACKVFALVFVFVLPRQKAETQELKRKGEKNVFIGNATLVMLVFVFIWTIMTNLMSIFPSTACLKVAGGSGCPSETLIV